MTKKEKQVLIDGLRKLSADAAEIAALLEGSVAKAKEQNAPTEEAAPGPEEEVPAKVYTYEAIDETDYVRRRLIKIHERELKKRVISKGTNRP